MNCALWLNRRKVYSAEEICDDPDIASLCGYFCAGSLIEWLRTHNGEKYAEKLEKISPKDPELKEKIGMIFGGQSASYKQFGKDNSSENKSLGISENPSSAALRYGSKTAFAASKGFYSHKGSNVFGFSSYSFTSYLLQIGFGSAKTGSLSYNSGIFGFEWEWEWERFLAGYGSFYKTSFVGASGRFFYGSFMSAFRAYLMRKYGSRGGFSPGSRGSFSGSFEMFGIPDSDEYDRILMECVFGCRLNDYGYGIHNI